MIIYHQSNVAAFVGNHTVYWPLNPITLQRISITSAVVADEEIAQSRNNLRFIFSRIFGRVN